MCKQLFPMGTQDLPDFRCLLEMKNSTYLGFDKNLTLSLRSEQGEALKFTSGDVLAYVYREISDQDAPKASVLGGMTMQDLLYDLFDANSKTPKANCSRDGLAMIHCQLLGCSGKKARQNYLEFTPVTSFILDLGGGKAKLEDWYRSALDVDAKNKKNAELRTRIGPEINTTITSLIQGGQHRSLGAFDWSLRELIGRVDDNLFDAKTAYHRIANGLHYIVSKDSKVPLQDIIQTIECLERAGYDLMDYEDTKKLFQNFIEFDGHIYLDPLLHRVAEGVKQENNHALEVLTYLVSRGMDPEVTNAAEKKPMDLLGNQEIKEKWTNMLRNLNTRNTALDILNELLTEKAKP